MVSAAEEVVRERTPFAPRPIIPLPPRAMIGVVLDASKRAANEGGSVGVTGAEGASDGNVGVASAGKEGEAKPELKMGEEPGASSSKVRALEAIDDRKDCPADCFAIGAGLEEGGKAGDEGFETVEGFEDDRVGIARVDLEVDDTTGGTIGRPIPASSRSRIAAAFCPVLFPPSATMAVARVTLGASCEDSLILPEGRPIALSVENASGKAVKDDGEREGTVGEAGGRPNPIEECLLRSTGPGVANCSKRAAVGEDSVERPPA